jgi:hypothetical protein
MTVGFEPMKGEGSTCERDLAIRQNYSALAGLSQTERYTARPFGDSMQRGPLVARSLRPA